MKSKKIISQYELRIIGSQKKIASELHSKCANDLIPSISGIVIKVPILEMKWNFAATFDMPERLTV